MAGQRGQGALFLQGFDVRWHARPHRVSGLGFGASGVGDDGELLGRIWGRIRGGTWASGAAASDAASLQVKYAAIQSPGVHVSTARAELVLRGSRRQRDEEGPAETSVTVELDVPVLAGDDALVAWISGFDFDTTASHENGYTPHAIAVTVAEPRRLPSGRVAVDVSARLDGAPVPDRRQKLAEYASAATVEVVVVAAEHAHAERLSTGLDEDVPALEQGALRRAPQRLPLSAALHDDVRSAVGGLSGFSLEVDADGPISGRYLRAMTVAVEDERLDLARGSYDAAAALRFANDGTIPRRLHVAAHVDVSLLQLHDPAAVRRGRWQSAEGQQAAVAYPSMAPLPEGPWGAAAPSSPP